MSSLGVALVTGAARGIGRGVALRLAKDGFDVGINDLPASREGLESLKAQIEGMGRKSTIAVGDVSIEANVENMVSTVVKDLGRLDVMVANAGIISSALRSFTETGVEDWDKTLAVNARGVFLCYKYAALQMIKQGQGGRIIGASSVAGRQGKWAGVAYSASKFAVRGLTQAAAAELGRHGITVNSYCPGAINTDLLKEASEMAKVPEDVISGRLIDQSAVGYIGKVEDVANAVSFLASKDSHFITGQGLGVDGGLHFS